MTAKYLLFFRTLLLITVVLQSLYAPEAEKGITWLIILCVGYGSCAIALFLLEIKGILKTEWSHWTFSGDIVVTCFALYMSPGHTADYYLAFFIVVLSSTLMQKPPLSFLIAGVACVVYAEISLTSYDAVYHPEKLMNLVILMVTAFFSTFVANHSRTLEKDAQDRYEEKLAWMQRLTTVGKALSGVLHEVKTPLGTILLNAEHVRSLVGDKKELSEPLEMIEQEAERASEILLNFLEFTKPSQLERGPLLACEPVEHVLKTLRAHLEERDVDVSVELDRVTRISASRRHLTQVFTNIVMNAVDAMPLGGTLSVRSDATGGTARVVFEDTGDGVAPERMKTLFEPFETTRGESGGSGLGLSIVRWIVQKHDGEVRVESPGAGQGTRVTVEFPVLMET